MCLQLSFPSKFASTNFTGKLWPFGVGFNVSTKPFHTLNVSTTYFTNMICNLVPLTVGSQVILGKIRSTATFIVALVRPNTEMLIPVRLLNEVSHRFTANITHAGIRFANLFASRSPFAGYFRFPLIIRRVWHIVVGSSFSCPSSRQLLL